VSAADLLGWAGALGILAAYGLLTVGRWRGDSLRYQGVNTVAAVALVIWAVSISAWQSVLLNVVWASVGLVGVVRAVRHRPDPHPPVPRGD
jgi:hypothetical protein